MTGFEEQQRTTNDPSSSSFFTDPLNSTQPQDATATTTAPQPKKRGRPPKKLQPGYVPPERPPKQPRSAIPKQPAFLDPAKITSYTPEDIEHVRAIQRRIQTCMRKNLNYLIDLTQRYHPIQQTVPRQVGDEDLELKSFTTLLPGADRVFTGKYDARQFNVEEFTENHNETDNEDGDILSSIENTPNSLKSNVLSLSSNSSVTVERLVLDLLPFHVYGSLLEPTSIYDSKTYDEYSLITQSISMLNRIDTVLLEQDERNTKTPVELLLVEERLFLEEEKFIFALLKQEFFKKYGRQYGAGGD